MIIIQQKKLNIPVQENISLIRNFLVYALQKIINKDKCTKIFTFKTHI